MRGIKVIDFILLLTPTLSATAPASPKAPTVGAHYLHPCRHPAGEGVHQLNNCRYLCLEWWSYMNDALRPSAHPTSEITASQ
jgi:hypothetical protein